MNAPLTFLLSDLLASIPQNCSFLISSHLVLFLSDSHKTLLSSQKRCKYESFPHLSQKSRRTHKHHHEQMVAVLSAIEELLRKLPSSKCQQGQTLKVIHSMHLKYTAVLPLVSTHAV
jgi:hypothetical protein